MKRIAVLGSTGSVGRQTLEVAQSCPDKVQVVALASGRNSTLLAQQVAYFKPSMVCSLEPLEEELLTHTKSSVTSLEEIARHPKVDLVVVATSGIAGLAPTLAGLEAGKTVALANKEVLVTAGEIVMETARNAKAAILPIDSEHSGLWQCLRGDEAVTEDVESITITASGGAFRDYPAERLAYVTAEEALKHPTWRMGPKITVDSATLMNKGLEVIEAHWLFKTPLDRIKIVLHRESVVHSLVELSDGSMRVQLSQPDMLIPIQYALSYPERWENPRLPRLDMASMGPLTFAQLDRERYPCLELALEAGRLGGTYPAALVGADEAAVELFLGGCIAFPDIPRLVENAMQQHKPMYKPSLQDILEAEESARQLVTRDNGG